MELYRKSSIPVQSGLYLATLLTLSGMQAGCGQDVLLTSEHHQGASTAVYSLPVPQALSDNPDDPDWVFDGYLKELSEEERLERRQRNDYIRTLTEKEYQEYKIQRRKENRRKQRLKALRNGLPFDERDDLYVAILPDKQVWRRKVSGGSGHTHGVARPFCGIETVEGIPALQQLQWNEKEEASLLQIDEDQDRLQDGNLNTTYCPFTSCSSGFDSSHEIHSLRTKPAMHVDHKDVGDTEKLAEVSSKEVFGTDTRRLISRASGYNLTRYPWRTHGTFTRASVGSNDNPIDGNCTGAKVSARVVLTAGHCLYDGGWSASADKWIPGPDGIDRYVNNRDPSPNGWKTWTAKAVHPDWFDDGDYKDDIGWYILLDNQSSCNLGWLGYDDESNLDNDTVNLFGVPGEYQSCAASLHPGDFCWSSIYGTSGTITRARVSTIRYGIDTGPAQSGSAVYKYYSSSGNRYVVGVHSGQWDSNENVAVRMNDGKCDRTSGAVNDYRSTICE